jgi:hypothetical protein
MIKVGEIMPGQVNRSEDIRIERIWSMPNKNTFEIAPIKKLLTEEVDLTLIWIDPFANRNKIASITNDLNMTYDTTYHMDALDFLKMFADESVDGVLYDPPYSPRQVSECYNDVGYNVTWDTTKASFWGNHKREISRIVKKGGKVITFGWNSGGIGYKYGFEITRILLVPHGGWHNDTICTVEIKTHDPIQKKKTNVTNLEKKSMKSKIDEQLISELGKLPIDYWDFKESDTKEFTHGIHNYPAMMVSPISRNIIRIMSNKMEINTLLDPFAGSGTVLVEGMLAGIKHVTGSDINPLALYICKAKTTLIDCDLLQTTLDLLKENINLQVKKYSKQIDSINEYIQITYSLDLTDKKGWGDEAPKYIKQFYAEEGIDLPIPDFKNLGYWCKPKVILLLSIIRCEIDKITNSDIRRYINIAFSETIRLVSNRRNGEFKMFRMTASKVMTFDPDVITEFENILNRNLQKMIDFVSFINEHEYNPNVNVYNNNACTLEDILDDYYDLIITSPPYGDSRTTVAYGEYSRLSLQWINDFLLTDKEIMGVDRSLMGGSKYRNGFEYSLNSDTLKRSLEKIKDVDIVRAGDVFSFYKDLNEAIATISKKTRKGGYHFWVVGNRTVKNELLQTDKIISELAQQYGMEWIYTIDRNIPNKVMPSLNSPTNETGKKSSTMTMEHIVILKKL